VQQTVPFEHGLRAIIFVATMRKRFDVTAEGLPSEKSRGDKTPLELFIGGVRDWEAGLRRDLCQVAGR
jgi:hypothetical protein